MGLFSSDLWPPIWVFCFVVLHCSRNRVICNVKADFYRPCRRCYSFLFLLMSDNEWSRWSQTAQNIKKLEKHVNTCLVSWISELYYFENRSAERRMTSSKRMCYCLSRKQAVSFHFIFKRVSASVAAISMYSTLLAVCLSFRLTACCLPVRRRKLSFLLMPNVVDDFFSYFTKTSVAFVNFQAIQMKPCRDRFVKSVQFHI